MKKPNILFLFSDQQRWDTLGCYNPNIDFTPNLDRLAEEGVKFKNAFSCQPVCGPARACLQTGRYATETGCYRNDIPLPQNVTTIADRFNKNGYDTAYIGKWHLASCGTKPVPQENRGGYNYWLASDLLEFSSDGYGGHMFDTDSNRVDFKGYRVDCQTDFVINYLEKRDSQKPFFLFVSYLEPHHQNSARHYQGPPESKVKFSGYKIPEDLKHFRKGDWLEEYPDYLGCCSSLDMNAGRIIETLKKLGEYENTVIVYTSDHGSHFRTRNGEYKRSCHDSSIHIPLIIRGLDFVGGSSVSDLVSLMDLPATLLKSGGINYEKLRGRPLQQLLSDDCKAYWGEDVFLQISESQVGRALRTEKWKYAVKAPLRNGWLHSGARVYREELLYDLEHDPCELNNLAGHKDHKETRKALRQRLINHMLEIGENKPVILDRRWRICR